jgi:hypothetical protein
MERGHPVRQRAKHALLHRILVQRLFALRAQADRDVRAPSPLPVLNLFLRLHTALQTIRLPTQSRKLYKRRLPAILLFL